MVGTYILPGAILYSNRFIFQGMLVSAILIVNTVLLVAPFLLRLRKKGSLNFQKKSPLFLAAFIFFLNILLLTARTFGWFSSFRWNWEGKIVSTIIALVFITLWPNLSWKNVGFTIPKQGTWSRVLIILSGSVLFYAIINYTNNPMAPDLETFLFQGTMPGIEEEIVYRGILWILIAQALPQSTRRFWGADVSWSLIITTILFALVHGVSVDQHFNIAIYPWSIIWTGITGFFFGWIRAYSGSLLPAIVLHNGMNLVIQTILLLLSLLLWQ